MLNKPRPGSAELCRSQNEDSPRFARAKESSKIAAYLTTAVDYTQKAHVHGAKETQPTRQKAASAAAGRFDRERLPEPLDYFESRGLTFKERRGKWRTTQCDFHGGKDSMRINTETGAWVCMACGVKGGDVLAYEMTATGASFPDAAHRLGAWTGGTPTAFERNRRPAGLSAADSLHVIKHDLLLIGIEASRAFRAGAVSAEDRGAVLRAVQRVLLIAGGNDDQH